MFFFVIEKVKSKMICKFLRSGVMLIKMHPLGGGENGQIIDKLVDWILV